MRSRAGVWAIVSVLLGCRAGERSGSAERGNDAGSAGPFDPPSSGEPAAPPVSRGPTTESEAAIDTERAAAEAIAQGRALIERGDFSGALRACAWVIADPKRESAARECASIAYAGLYDFGKLRSLFGCDALDDASYACEIELAQVLDAAGQPVGAASVLTGVLVDDEKHEPANRMRASVIAKVQALVTAAGMHATGGDLLAARSLSPRAFALELRARLEGGSGELGSLVHPTLGVFVVHDIPGHLAFVDRVRAWPSGDYEYADYVDPKTTEKIVSGTPTPCSCRTCSSISAASMGSGICWPSTCSRTSAAERRRHRDLSTEAA